jgi:hypothetical protein
MPVGNKTLWDLFGLSWSLDPEPRRATRRDNPPGVWSSDAVDARLDPVVTINGDGNLIDPEQDDPRDTLEKCWHTRDLREKRRWIWDFLVRPRWWLWLLLRPQYWKKFWQPQAGMILFPEERILANTLEVLHLFSDPKPGPGGEPSPGLSAEVDGKTALGRLFIIVHSTAKTLHRGSHHKVRLEIKNLGGTLVILTAEMRICQLIFHVDYGETVEDGCRHDIDQPLGREGV